MKIDWTPVEQELAHWRAAKLDLPIWWRDDDAISATPALEQLSDLSEELGVPVHLAVVPRDADETLVQFCAARRNLIPMIHGWAHKNHAPAGQKKSEFGQARDGMAADVQDGMARMQGLFGADFLPIFVPPWNRIDPEFVPVLNTLGVRGLSIFTPRRARMAAPGVVQINTHVDPINWRGGGGLLAPDQLVGHLVTTLQDRRQGHCDATEPLGLLTHHLVHDADIWAFTAECLAVLLRGCARPVNLREYLPD